APWVRAALVGVALLFPVVTPAAVDMTGLWRLHIELANNPGYLLDLTSHFLQSGTSLSNDLGYMGSIDPDTGQFSLFAPSTECGAVDTMYGSASADNLRFAATGPAHTGNPCPAGNVCDHTCNESVHSCNAALGTACAGDGNACTLDRCDGNGACTHVPTPGEAGDCPACELCDATGACAPRPRTCTMSTNPKTRLNVTNRTQDD